MNHELSVLSPARREVSIIHPGFVSLSLLHERLPMESETSMLGSCDLNFSRRLGHEIH